MYQVECILKDINEECKIELINTSHQQLHCNSNRQSACFILSLRDAKTYPIAVTLCSITSQDINLLLADSTHIPNALKNLLLQVMVTNRLFIFLRVVTPVFSYLEYLLLI